METRLTVELVPSTCWYTNVRSNVSKAVWDRLRRRVASEAGQRCEVCSRRGRHRWALDVSVLTTHYGVDPAETPAQER